MSKEFKVGDKVYCLTEGEGVVYKTSNDDSPEYPICVRFTGMSTASHTMEGRLFMSNKHPTLFHGSKCPSWFPKEVERVRAYQVVYYSTNVNNLVVSEGHYQSQAHFDYVQGSSVRIFKKLLNDIDCFQTQDKWEKKEA